MSIFTRRCRTEKCQLSWPRWMWRSSRSNPGLWGPCPQRFMKPWPQVSPSCWWPRGRPGTSSKSQTQGWWHLPEDFALCQAANRLVADPGLRKTLGRAGRKAAIQTHNRREIAHQYAAELQRRFGLANPIKPIAPRGHSIQRVEGKIAYASRGYTILRSTNGGGNWQEDGIIAVSGWEKPWRPPPTLKLNCPGRGIRGVAFEWRGQDWPGSRDDCPGRASVPGLPVRFPVSTRGSGLKSIRDPGPENFLWRIFIDSPALRRRPGLFLPG